MARTSSSRADDEPSLGAVENWHWQQLWGYGDRLDREDDADDEPTLGMVNPQ